ncbi:sn-glycerol-3-phosphate import ATP-binding protein UgpC [Corynebacterium glaucum]|uniref:ABC transporter ATP-binding protein n=1 Tax=Corynebacterium glaucum TaxID=187491 RepID=UPI0025B2EF83|nr:sn-glycerol-3-phosphate ABC transporter ATP-binding protein UgpC [Corynebacterium glaucum]WJZ06830.1 sn-glycerol-3-phosphate import ATP-binding protein UgpC [Corynebacterium glaucum]
MAAITFDKATLHYPGNPRPTINNMDLAIRDGEFVAVVGPSGSGKSTTLRMVAGLEKLTGGEIYIGDTPASTLAPSKRDVAMVFQSYALYPHMTVAENMAFALKMQNVSKDEQQKRVAEASRLLDLDQYLERLPKALSGGQRQRVAMGRAIVRDPQVFLMDEPLSNLDAKLRVSTRAEISQLQRRLNTTMLYVTHDQTEAMTMADRIAVLEGGDMQQVGSPEELYLTPANTFVATFIGTPSMNMMTGTIEGSEITIGHIRLPLPPLAQQPTSNRVVLGIRPENLEVVSDGQGDTRAAAEYVENFGSDKYVHASIDGLNDLGDFIIRVPNTLRIAAGDAFDLRFDRDFLHLFDAETTARIN